MATAHERLNVKLEHQVMKRVLTLPKVMRNFQIFIGALLAAQQTVLANV